jgi:hypothetical protein
MILSEILSLVAELAIALAGFASLVAILGNRQARDDVTIEAIRLQGMLEYALITAAFALLPHLPYSAGLSEDLTWRLCSAVFATIGATYLVVAFRRSTGVRSYPIGRPRGFFVPHSRSWVVVSLGLVGSAVTLLLAGAFGLLPRPEVGYLWGLYAYLSIAALLFLRLVMSLLEGRQ